MNFLAFCSSKFLKVVGATITEKKTLLPTRRGIVKFFTKVDIKIICSIIKLDSKVYGIY